MNSNTYVEVKNETVTHSAFVYCGKIMIIMYYCPVKNNTNCIFMHQNTNSH